MNKITPFRYFFKFKNNQGFSKRVMDISAAKKIININQNIFRVRFKNTWNWFLKNQKHYKLRKNYFS